MPMAMSTRERHSAARIDSNASMTGCWAITVQPTLGSTHRERNDGLAVLAGRGDRRSIRGADDGLEAVEIPCTGTAAQHKADVRMGNQTPCVVDDKGVSGVADLDRRDDIPDQFEVDVGNDDPGGRAVSRNRDPHVRLGIALIVHRAIPDPVGARADNRGIRRHISAAAGSVHAHAGYENPFGAGRVDHRERNDRRHLLQQTQPVDPAPVVLARRPGKLHDPTELIAYSVGESLYPVGCGAGLDLKEFIEIEAIVAKREPGFGCGTKHERRHHCDKQRDEVLHEQGAARTCHRRKIRWKEF